MACEALALLLHVRCTRAWNEPDVVAYIYCVLCRIQMSVTMDHRGASRDLRGGDLSQLTPRGTSTDNETAATVLGKSLWVCRDFLIMSDGWQRRATHVDRGSDH